MKLNTTAEWLLSFGAGDEPSGYVSVGDRKVLNQRRAQAESQAANAQTFASDKAEAIAVHRAEATHMVTRKAR